MGGTHGTDTRDTQQTSEDILTPATTVTLEVSLQRAVSHRETNATGFHFPEAPEWSDLWRGTAGQTSPEPGGQGQEVSASANTVPAGEDEMGMGWMVGSGAQQ